MYHTEIPEELITSFYIPGWDLGDVYLTDGIGDLVENLPPNVDLIYNLLKSHLCGDYGLVNDDAMGLMRNKQARKEGRLFTGIFKIASEFIKVVTNPSRNRTVICLVSED